VKEYLRDLEAGLAKWLAERGWRPVARRATARPWPAAAQQRADLAITSWVDAHLSTGPTIHITTTVTNLGDKASNSTTVNYYLSTDAVITSSDISVGSASVPSLAANGQTGDSSTVTSSFAAPTGVAAGGYWLGAIVDPNNDGKREWSDTTSAVITRTANLVQYNHVITGINTTGLRLYMQVGGSGFWQGPGGQRATVVAIDPAAGTVTLDLAPIVNQTGATLNFYNNNVRRHFASAVAQDTYPFVVKEPNGVWKHGGPYGVGAENMPSDAIGMRYTLHVNDGHGIIFHEIWLSTPRSAFVGNTILTDVMNQWLEYTDNVSVPAWGCQSTGGQHVNEPSLWVSNRDYSWSGRVGHTTSNPTLYPRQHGGIDGSTGGSRQDAIHQGDITGQDITIEIRRRAQPVTYTSPVSGLGYRFVNQGFTGDMPAGTYWVWDVTVTQPSGPTTITMYKRDDEGQYVGSFNLATEFVEFAGTGQYFLWNVSALSENSNTWMPMNEFAIGAGTKLFGLGPRVATYQGHPAIEIATGIDMGAYAQDGAHLDISAVAAPTNLAAVWAAPQVNLTWSDNANNETSYVVQRNTGGPWTTIATLVANATSYTDATGANLYSYRVFATSSFGGSNMSNVAGVNAPVAWSNGDIGNVPTPGSASETAGTFTVNGSGCVDWDTADAFHYVYKPWAGEGQIVARVVSSNSAWHQYGVMFRETLAGDARNVFMGLQTEATGKTIFRHRDTPGAFTGGSELLTGGAAPYWVKLVRSGDTFTGSVAPDNGGTPGAWTVVGTHTVTLQTSIFVGLVSTNSAIFDHVTIG
jgi:hypothetical protein